MRRSGRWLTWYYSSGLGIGFSRGVTREPREQPLIVSLTTVPGRYASVVIALGSLFRQTVKPDRILLWVGNTASGEPPVLPKKLLRLQKRGLEIHYRPDLGPHTKLIYSLKEYPDAVVVTADDDWIYPSEWLEGLYRSYLDYPNQIHCYRARRMRYADDGKLLPVKKWKLLFSTEERKGLTLFPTGNAGVLYPPDCFDEEVFNQALFQKLCPRQDDVWFKAMSLLKNVACRKVPIERKKFLVIPGTQDSGLWESFNSVSKDGDNNNDRQLRAVFDHYSLDKKLL